MTKKTSQITWPEQPLKYASMAEWQAEATRRFGPDYRKWRFVCPACGHVASVADWKALGAIENAAFSCVGRWTKEASEAFSGKPGPCTYTGGGLFRLNPIAIDGREDGAFAFAEAQKDEPLNLLRTRDALAAYDAGWEQRASRDTYKAEEAAALLAVREAFAADTADRNTREQAMQAQLEWIREWAKVAP